MSFMLTPKSQQKLAGVHRDLCKVVELAAVDAPEEYTFIVTEGVRSIDRQKELVQKNLSRTMNSRHLHGLAVDLAVVKNGNVSWHFVDYANLAYLMKAAAAKAGVPINWGGDWTSLKDGPHFELPSAFYPDLHPTTA